MAVPQLPFPLSLPEDIPHESTRGVFHDGAEGGPGGQVLKVEGDVVGLCERVQVNVIELEQVIALKGSNGGHVVC
jgi:hypothetical protein